MKNIVLVTNDIIGDRCAGPGIRYIELGRIIVQKGYHVTLLGKNPSFTSHQPFSYDSLTLRNLIKYLIKSDCLIIRGGGPLTTLLVLLVTHNKDRIADLYAFTHFEVPHLTPTSFFERYIVEVRKIFHDVKLKFYCKYFKNFWVANDRQRDFLYGVLYTTKNLREEKDITLIPFGYPSTKPVKKKAVLRGVVDGIDEDDFILIWGGGVWDWLDPVTLIKAMSQIWGIDKKIKLYFMGVKAPSGYLPEKGKELIRVSKELGLLNKNVFINDSWTPYEERIDFLLEADVGISLHPKSLETLFSFRTRNLDYIYCGLPMVHSEGDVWAEIINKNRLGLVVPTGNEHEVANAILRLYNDKSLLSEMKENIDKISSEFIWENIASKAVDSIKKNLYRNKTPLLLMSMDIVGAYFIFGLKSIFFLFKTLFTKSQKKNNIN